MNVLAKLIKEYPDLPVVALVDKHIFDISNEYTYDVGIVDTYAPHLEYIYRGKKTIYRQHNVDDIEIFENEVGVLTPDNEDKFVDFCKHIKWEKVIIVYVDGVANE